jgi:hypothetical protein
MSDPIDWVARLERDGYLERAHDGLRTTKRWQAAMSRAARELYVAGETLTDLRVPIAAALVECYADARAEDLADAVGVMLPIETAELSMSIAKLS